MNTDYKQKIKSAIELCNEDGKIAILSADTDRVKSYVYSSTKLSEMRGASSILDDLNQEDIEKIFNKEGLNKDCILFNKGGSVLAIVPSSKAEKVKSEIEILYPKNTHGLATITVVTEIIDHSELESGFKEIIKKLSNKLRKAKEEKKEFPVYEVIPYARRCDSCGIRPANFKYEYPEETYLCKSCSYKRDRGVDEKSGFIRKFKQFLEEKNDDNYKRIVKEYEKLNKNYDILKKPQEIKDIEDENGYIGVIYADGNEIGNIIENKLDSPWKFIEFSEKLYDITEKSTYSAIAKYIVPKGGILPFEIVSIGGDDLFIILPADITFQVIDQLCKNLEDRLKNSGMKEMENITFSFGTTITKSNFPIYYIYDLVNQLLKNAKKKAKENEGQTRNAIDFMVFKSQGGEVSSISEYRTQILTLESQKSEQIFKLTLRPYLMEDFDKLIDFAKKMNQEDFPKSKLYALRESIEYGKEYSILFYLYMLSKSQEKEKKLIGYELKEKIFSEYNKMIPWIEEIHDGKYKEYKTPIVDILEIYDFIKDIKE